MGRETSRGPPPADAPILLKINLEAGHGGASGRFEFLKEIALDFAFAIWAIERGWEAQMKDQDGERGRRGRAFRRSMATTSKHGFGTFEEIAPESRRR